MAAVALMMGAARWGSYIGVPPVFLTDMLIAGAFIHHGLGRVAVHPAHRVDIPTAPLPALRLLLAWVVLRFVFSWDLSMGSLRDFAPYLYAALGLLAARSVGLTTDRARRTTAHVLIGALAFHAIWYTAVVIFPTLPEAMPVLSDPVRLLTPRPDIDSTLNGIFAGVLLVRLTSGGMRRPSQGLILFLVASAGVVLGSSRAGLLGAALAIGLAFVISLRHNPQRAKMILAGAPIVLLAGIAWLPQTTLGERLSGTFGGTESAAAAGAAGTTDARQHSWEILQEWILADSGRAAVGVGFGPNFMLESGASIALIGPGDERAAEVRSPHDYWLGTLARTGLVGLSLVLIAVAGALRKVWHSREAAVEDELLLVASLVVVSVVAPATFGVVLESPFGAVPFWWSVGVVATLGSPKRGAKTVRPTSAKVGVMRR